MIDTHADGKQRARPIGLLIWWGVLALLPPLELLGVTVAFDAPITAWDQAGGLVAWLFHHKKQVSYGVVTSLAAGVLLAGRSLIDRLRDVLGSGEPSRPALAGWGWLAVHGLGFAAFFGLTGLIFRGSPESWTHPALLFLAWAGLGLAVVLSWGLAALPGQSWLSLFRERHRQIAAAALLGATAAGLAPSFERFLWGKLDLLTLQCALALLRTFAEPVYDPQTRLLGIPPFAVTISPQCSGIEGVLLIWIFLGAYLWFERRSLAFPRAFLLIPLATVLIWCLNTLRIVVLICLGRWVSEEVALKSFHSQAGWIAFNAVALGLVWGTQRLRFFRRAEAIGHPDPGAATAANPVLVYVAPFTAIVATTMVTSAFAEGGFDALYPLRVLAAGGTLWCLRRRPSSLRMTCSWPAAAIGVLVYLIWMAAEFFLGMGDGSALRSRLLGLPPSAAAVWLGFRLVGSVIIVPVAEELAFRGFLARRLISADFDEVSPRQFTWLSFVGSSLLFGSLHGTRWFAATLAGMCYALAVYRRGELADAVFAHAVTNGLIAASVLAGGCWALWA